MKTDFTQPAFQLMLACTNWSADPAQRDAAIVEAHAALDEDWPNFEALLQRHQLVTPAIRSLKAAGVTPPQTLVENAERTQLRTLQLFGRSLMLVRELEKKGIGAALLKGPLLSDMLFDDPGLRHSSDIDILVEWDDFRRAIEVLEQLGLKLFGDRPPFDSWRIEPWRAPAKDVTFLDPEHEVAVELHHRLKSPEALLPGLSLADAREEHRLGGNSLAVFLRDDLFVYLCAHGSTSFWHRLKWLADIHALTAQLSDDEIERFQARSQTLGTERCTALALMLIAQLWKRKPQPFLIQMQREDAALKQLCEASLKRLCASDRAYTSWANTFARRDLARLRKDAEYRKALRQELVQDRELLERYDLGERFKWLYLPLRIWLFCQRKLGIERRVRPID